MKFIEAIEQLEDLRENRKSFVLLKDFEAIEVVLNMLQPIKKIIAPSRRNKKNTYEFGLIVGTKREREYWKDKIKEKIEEIKNKPNNPNQKVIATQIDASLIACLQELLKEE